VKEVHSIIVNERTVRSGRLCGVIFANDISGIRNIPDQRFSKALTDSSAQYEKLYPSLAGTTMVLNLPFLLQAFVGLFKPLFPKSVQVSQLNPNSTPDLSQLNQDFTPDLSQLNPNSTPDLSQLNQDFTPDLSQLHPNLHPGPVTT
jgi:hypothetical protein